MRVFEVISEKDNQFSKDTIAAPTRKHVTDMFGDATLIKCIDCTNKIRSCLSEDVVSAMHAYNQIATFSAAEVEIVKALLRRACEVSWQDA